MEGFPVMGQTPASGYAEAVFKFYQSDMVFLSEPVGDAVPCIGIDRVKGSFRRADTEVGSPSS